MAPGAQTCPQEPQFVALDDVSTHVPLQQLSVPTIELVWQQVSPHCCTSEQQNA